MKQEYTLGNNAEKSLKLYISGTKSQIDTELAKLASGLTQLSLHPHVDYALLSNGKRLRPLLVILSAESVGGKRNNVMHLASAFELMHTATLVHDDIIDGDESRRGIPAVHKRWSVNEAILAGDALIALAVRLAAEYGETILKTVAQSALELCDGEHRDITSSLKAATRQQYYKRIKEKSASLFRSSTYCGALAGGGNPTETKELSAFGENFGIAYQLKDDLLDWTRNGNLFLNDLRNGRTSLPIIHYYVTCSSSQKKHLENMLDPLIEKKESTEKDEAEELRQVLKQAGSFNYCEKQIDEYLRQAVDSISDLRNTEYKLYLNEMAETLKAMT
ncbi:MAG TPA: polyprenyl synthetase family protein [Candidatus Bathyarchaeia archaeon]|nr:polyprenyl synthetase family protein [Candidatus Bathyarchaeia archaeon]